ncbi:hypothetical protein Cfor_05551 [Coptotermes formosanus]|uniref:Tc1-like transposase DDE domain-containing protein n=1 Tax=Coptotermes formosanus TaxID=36987 RepID=A0A6L2PP81_COPFO|nr:hypothetical protein Cfor_05551 [Coptotermes formosanus]
MQEEAKGGCLCQAFFLSFGISVTSIGIPHLKLKLGRDKKKWLSYQEQGANCKGIRHPLSCHTAGSINEFLAEKSIPVVLQPPYSPDLSPCDFFLFHRLKNHLKGGHFGTLDNIQKSVTDELKGIPTEAFQYCYEQWKQRLRRCVAAQGNYFEGDNLDL